MNLAKVFAEKARVIISSSKCIFENLAFEEWLFRNYDIQKYGELMLLWSNNPAVVIGRFQNPWVEANMPFLTKNDISLVRRYSGGGAVYHDLGNINVSILTVKKRHSRRRNLQMIADSLNQNFNLHAVRNDRDDLWLQPGMRKFSGTAARIACNRAYHHLTLLVKVDVDVLKESLRSPYQNRITTNATCSVRAPAVGFLTQDDSKADGDSVMSAVIAGFREQYEECEVKIVADVRDEILFHGVSENEKFLRSWDWIFGKSPKFSFRASGNVLHFERGVVTEVEGSRQDLVGLQMSADVPSL